MVCCNSFTIVRSFGLGYVYSNPANSLWRVTMYLFEFLIALGGNRSTTARVRLRADNAYDAQQLAFMQYGQSNIINYSQLSE